MMSGKTISHQDSSLMQVMIIDALNLIRRIYAAQERPFLQLSDDISDATKQQIIHNTSQIYILVARSCCAVAAISKGHMKHSVDNAKRIWIGQSQLAV